MNLMCSASFVYLFFYDYINFQSFDSSKLCRFFYIDKNLCPFTYEDTKTVMIFYRLEII